jgi:NTE family protein
LGRARLWLILVSVDVAEGAPVVFDSYEKQDGSRKTEYGKYIVKEDGKELGFTHIIRYNDGITSDQVIASASVPINFGTALEVESYNKATSKSRIADVR